MRVQMINNGNCNINIQFKVSSKELISNLTTPVSYLQSTVPYKNSKEICTLMKKVPKRNWEEIEWSYQYQEDETVVLSPQYKPQEPVMGEVVCGPQLPNTSAGFNTFNDICVPAGEVSCPKCTLFNLVTALKCDACGAMLN